jgi:hypothetical protein
MSIEDIKKGKKRSSREMLEESPYYEYKKLRDDSNSSPRNITSQLNKLTVYNLALMDFLKAIDYAHKNTESDEDEENVYDEDDDSDGESIDNEDDAISDSEDDSVSDFDLSTTTGRTLTSCKTESQLSGICSLDDTIEDTDNLACLDTDVLKFKETREFFMLPMQ